MTVGYFPLFLWYNFSAIQFVFQCFLQPYFMRNYKNPFIHVLLGCALLVSTVSVAQDAEVPQGQRTGETYFLVFAPNEFDHLHNAPEFQNGMRMIAEQLARSEVPKQNIVLLHGQADEPSRLGTITNVRRELERFASVPREDRIVLFALTHGVNANGKDYLADQKTSQNGFLSGNENEMIAVSEIVSTLAKSPAEHKWVLVDSATFELPIENVSVEKGLFVIADTSTSNELLARYSDESFGTSPLSMPDNFVVSINRGRRIHQSSDEDFVSSVFLRSFIFAISTEDRFSPHGQQVLLQETLDTMNRFLAVDNHPLPAVSGSFNSNALLLPNRAESAGLIPIAPEMWQTAIAQEIEAASKLILLYYRPKDAVALLRQTEAQLNSLQQYGQQFAAYAERARILRRMAQAMLGELEQVWQESQQAGDPLFLYVIRDQALPPLSRQQPTSRTSTQQTQPPVPQQPQQSMVGRLVKVKNINRGVVEYDFAIRLRLVDDTSSRARKLTFLPIDSSRVGELSTSVFFLGNTDPVSPFLESAFNREEFDNAP